LTPVAQISDHELNQWYGGHFGIGGTHNSDNPWLMGRLYGQGQLNTAFSIRDMTTLRNMAKMATAHLATKGINVHIRANSRANLTNDLARMVREHPQQPFAIENYGYVVNV
jgi:hypothetical protein